MSSSQPDEVLGGCARIAELARRGLQEQALQECRGLADRFPDRAEPSLQLGALLLREGDRVGAEKALRACLAVAPAFGPALSLMGDLLFDKRDLAGALDCFVASVRLRPDDGRLWNNIAITQLGLGHFEEAEAAARRARTLEPESAIAWLNLGRALAARTRRDEALGAVQESLRLDPVNSDACDLAGRLHAQAGGYVRAAQLFRRALDARMEAMTASRLGDALLQLGDAAGAISAYRDAQERDGIRAAEHASQVLFAMHADERATAADILAAHRDWARRYAGAAVPAAFDNSRDPERCLRVAYVSARFRRSSSAFLLLPVLERHDPGQVTFFCYAEQDSSDEVTERIRARAGAWRDTRGLDDGTLARAIREDRIDIVVDLAGHTPGNRLTALARKNAPVNLTWLDYFDTTGCESFDAIVTDAHHSPRGDSQAFAERRLRLDPLRFVYAPPEYAPKPAPIPSAAGKAIVFGAFHRFAKIGPGVVRAWAQLLDRIGDARLIIKNDALGDERDRAWHRERLSAAGLPMARVELRGASTHSDLLAQYGEIDIALDTFPYNGGITTLEALWMGRPVVAVHGDTMISRQSAAILRVAGLEDLVARSVGEMVELAASLSADRERLLGLASELRGRLAASAVCDAQAFTRSLEKAYREAWRAWCAGSPIGEAQ